MNKKQLDELRELREEIANKPGGETRTVRGVPSGSLGARQSNADRMRSTFDKTDYEIQLEQDAALERARLAAERDEQKMQEMREAGQSGSEGSGRTPR